MRTSEIYDVLCSTGLPVAYLSFTEETAKPCPFICYFFAKDHDVIADNRNYVSVNHLYVELYTDNKNFSLERTIEEALNAAGIVWTRTESYIESELMYQIVYESEVIING